MNRSLWALALASISVMAVAAPHVKPPEAVIVKNSAGAPVLTTEAVSRTPFIHSLSLSGELYLVPDGQVLVLQMVTGRKNCRTIVPTSLDLSVYVPGETRSYEISIPMTLGFTNTGPTPGQNIQIYIATQQVSVNLGPGTAIGFARGGHGNCHLGEPIQVNLFGYMVPATSASFAP